MVSASIPGTAAISSSRRKASALSSIAVTCTRALAAAMCSAGGRTRNAVCGPEPYIPREPSGA